MGDILGVDWVLGILNNVCAVHAVWLLVMQSAEEVGARSAFSFLVKLSEVTEFGVK